MRANLRVTRAVAAPAERTWRRLVHWERQGEWIPATTVRSLDGRAVGGRIEARTAIGPVGFLDSMVITAWDPPRRCEVLHTGRLVRGPGSFTVDPLGPARCRVVWEETLDLPLGAAGRVGWWVVRPVARLGLWWALRRFARHVTLPETRSQPGGR